MTKLFNAKLTKGLTRRFVALVGGVAALSLSAFSLSAVAVQAADEPITMTLSHAYPTVTQHHKNVLWFKEQVEARTDGRLIVDVFPASQLMPITQEFNGMLSGQIDAAYNLNTIAATLDPLWGILELPFLFDITTTDQTHLREFVQSEKGGGALKASMKAKGITVVAIAPTDYVGAMINKKNAINTMADFDGLKIRIPGGRYLSQSIEALGASSIAMAYAEFSTAIVQGTVDGTVTGVLFTYDNKIPIDYLSDVPLWYAGLPLVISNRFYDKLPADIQQVLLEVGAELEVMGFADTENNVGATLEKISSEMGVQVAPTISAEERAKMVEATKPVIAAFISDNANGQAVVDEANRLRK